MMRPSSSNPRDGGRTSSRSRRYFHIFVLHLCLLSSIITLGSSLSHIFIRPTISRIHARNARSVAQREALEQLDSHGNPQRNFVIAFSGHQGSSAIADMLGALSPVFIPGFEPLDMDGISPHQKLDFMTATFNLPHTQEQYELWKESIYPVDTMRVDKRWLKSDSLGLLQTKSVAGFKLRPYTSQYQKGATSHTAFSGLDVEEVKQLFDTYNVSILVTQRQNRVKEALSWLKARDLGIRQFNAIKQPSILNEISSSSSKPVTVNVTALIDWLAYVDYINERLESTVRQLERPTATIQYEDFLADPVAVVQRAAEFIGVEYTDFMGLKHSSKFKKLGSDDLKKAVANFDEVCRHLQHTQYFRYLDVDSCFDSDSVETEEGDVVGSSSKSGIIKGSSTRSATRTLLLNNWCTARDKAATDWSSISDKECMERFTISQTKAIQSVRSRAGTLFFKHVHKAGGTTFCQLAQRNHHLVEDVNLPFRTDWTTNCVPYESFLGIHPAVVGGKKRSLQALWLGGACFFGFLTPAQLRVFEYHYRPLNFVASEGPLPDGLPLDQPLAMVTMLRNPLNRVLSSYKWWKFMITAMPQSPAECHSYSVASANASFAEWLIEYPDNWMTRELVGADAIYKKDRRHYLTLTEEHLTIAKQRLHLFAAVMIMEEWDASMSLMQHVFGWQELDYSGSRAGSRENSSAEEELVGEPEVLQQLREANWFDVQLYEYAVLVHKNQLEKYDTAV